MLIRRALREGPFDMKDLATEAGISYDALYSWAKGRRNPTPESIAQLAAGLRARAAKLVKLAEELEGGRSGRQG